MIKREKYIKPLREFYESDLIKIITGIRRCGKSVILRDIYAEIKDKSTNIIYLDFEDTAILNAIPDEREFSAFAKLDNSRQKIVISCDELDYSTSTVRHIRFRDFVLLNEL